MADNVGLLVSCNDLYSRAHSPNPESRRSGTHVSAQRNLGLSLGTGCRAHKGCWRTRQRPRRSSRQICVGTALRTLKQIQRSVRYMVQSGKATERRQHSPHGAAREKNHSPWMKSYSHRPLAKPGKQAQPYVSYGICMIICSSSSISIEVESLHRAPFWHGLLRHSFTSWPQFPPFVLPHRSETSAMLLYSQYPSVNPG